jgi:hypothetical protein
MVNGASAGARLGAWLHTGDLTGDFDNRELIVGSPDENSAAGVVRIYQRVATAAPDVFATISGGASGDRFGTTADAGFIFNRELPLVNGRPPSGTPLFPRDLIVGAPGAAGGRGTVYVFPGPFVRNGNRTAASATIRVIGAQVGDALGTLVESGDFNGDGYRELVLAVPSRGIVYVVNLQGAAATIDLSVSVPGTVITGLGHDISIATGDVNDDGVFDLAIGNPTAQSSRGSVYLILGARAALPPTRIMPTQVSASITGVDPGDYVGDSLWIADLDDDGDDAAELIIGASGGDTLGNSRPDAGEVFVIWGRSDIATNFRVGLHFLGAAPGHRLGARVTSGDINRDSPDDVTMLAPGANGGKGEIFVYFGRHDYEFTNIRPDMATQASRRIRADAASGAIETVRVWEATGEGAEEILAGVPSGSTTAGSLAGRVYIALSPSFSVPGSVSMSSGEGGTATTTIQVGNISQIPITWRATSTQGWLLIDTVTGQSTTSANGALTITANADTVGAGTHTAQVRIQSQDQEVRMTSVVNVTVTVSESRFVGLETPAAGANLPQPFVVRGWAIDTAVAAGTGVDQVEILGYPNPGSGQPPVVLGVATYGGSRPSVGSSYGARFANSGFEFTSRGVVPGSYQLAVRARSSTTGTAWQKPAGTVNVTVQRIVSEDDVNGDGWTDLLWHHTGIGRVAAWLMDGATQIQAALLNPDTVPTSWRLGAFQDFNADGKKDILWHDQTTGALTVWYMDGNTRTSTATPSPAMVHPSWRLAAAADFNRDGQIDLLWHHSSGQIGIWMMNGITQVGIVPMSPNWVQPTWSVAGTGDFNADGMPDLVWRHKNGNIGVWLMAEERYIGPVAIVPNFIAPDWRLAAVTDLNGDGKPDFVWHHQTLGNLGVWYLDGVTRIGVAALTPNRISPAWSLVGPR